MILEIRKDVAGKKKSFAAFQWSLSHELLTAKLHAYLPDISSLSSLQDFLLNFKQRKKVESFFGYWENILSGVCKLLPWAHFYSL